MARNWIFWVQNPRVAVIHDVKSESSGSQPAGNTGAVTGGHIGVSHDITRHDHAADVIDADPVSGDAVYTGCQNNVMYWLELTLTATCFHSPPGVGIPPACAFVTSMNPASRP